MFRRTKTMLYAVGVLLGVVAVVLLYPFAKAYEKADEAL